VDWRPFDYLTLETTPINRGPVALVIRRQFRAHYAALARILEDDRRAWSSAPCEPVR